jgi:transcriptional regulator with XRE-family HTH domain
MTVGNNIKKYREENGYTRKEFAELIGRTYNTLRCYECDIETPSSYVLLKMATVLDISILDILKGTRE